MSAAAAVAANSDPGFELPAGWEQVTSRAPRMAATMSAYLRWLSGRLDLRSVKAAEVCLRQFATYVTGTDRPCRSVAKITAEHVAGWETQLSRSPAAGRQRTVSEATIGYKLATLRRFFDQIRDSRVPDSPAENPALGRPARSRPPSRAFAVELTWEQIAEQAPVMAATMCAYLEQLTVSHRPSSVGAAARCVIWPPISSPLIRHAGRSARSSAATSSPTSWP